MSSDMPEWVIPGTVLIGLMSLLLYFFVDIRIEKKQKATVAAKSTRKLAPDAMPDKSAITCDASDCSKPGPSMRCSKCKMVYYCSQKCQRSHWKEHKTDCNVAVQQIYKKFAKDDKADSSNNSETTEKSKNDTCGICLADRKDMVNPVILKACQHAFCFPCLKKYQDYNDAIPSTSTSGVGATAAPSVQRKSTCPYCRTEMEDVKESIIAKALLYATQAAHTGKPEEERLRLCQLALDQMKTLGKPACDQDIIQANIICGQIATTRGDFKDALAIHEQNCRILAKTVARKKEIDALLGEGQRLGSSNHEEEEIDEETYKKMQEIQNKILALMAEGGMAKESDLIDGRLEVVATRMKMEEWETATTMYKELMTEFPEQSMLTPIQQRRIFMGFARCLFEMGNYDGSIALGEAAIEMNRHFPGVHKYVALAYKASGKIEQAQKMMAQAVLYETPWDPQNVAEARMLWIEMMS